MEPTKTKIDQRYLNKLNDRLRDRIANIFQDIVEQTQDSEQRMNLAQDLFAMGIASIIADALHESMPDEYCEINAEHLILDEYEKLIGAIVGKLHFVTTNRFRDLVDRDSKLSHDMKYSLKKGHIKKHPILKPQCPICKTFLNGFHIDNTPISDPEVGDICFCLECELPLKFDNNLQLVEPNTKELEEGRIIEPRRGTKW